MDVGSDGFSGDADVGEGEVVGDNAAPTVGTEFDGGIWHGLGPVLLSARLSARLSPLLGKQRKTITGEAERVHGKRRFGKRSTED
jgi:hypothetical protein